VCAQETSSTDDSDEKAGEKNICGEEGSDGDHSFEASQSETNGSCGKGKRSSEHDNVTSEVTDDSNSDAFEDEPQLPGNLEKLFKTLLYFAFHP